MPRDMPTDWRGKIGWLEEELANVQRYIGQAHQHGYLSRPDIPGPPGPELGRDCLELLGARLDSLRGAMRLVQEELDALDDEQCPECRATGMHRLGCPDAMR